MSTPDQKNAAVARAQFGDLGPTAAGAGAAFFRKGKGENLLRFCFAKKDDELDEACRRLREFKG